MLLVSFFQNIKIIVTFNSHFLVVLKSLYDSSKLDDFDCLLNYQYNSLLQDHGNESDSNRKKLLASYLNNLSNILKYGDFLLFFIFFDEFLCFSGNEPRTHWSMIGTDTNPHQFTIKKYHSFERNIDIN